MRCLQLLTEANKQKTTEPYRNLIVDLNSQKKNKILKSNQNYKTTEKSREEMDFFWFLSDYVMIVLSDVFPIKVLKNQKS